MATSPDRPIASLVEAKMVEAYAAKVDELHSIIDRAAEVLGAIPEEMLNPRREDPALGPYIGAILAARLILAEADPEDLETPEGRGGIDVQG